MKKTVIFLTSLFPYEGGEQFIESEIKYWGNYDVKLIIIPLLCEGEPRNYPKNAVVDMCLYKQLNTYSKVKGIIKGLFSALLFSEIINLIKEKKISLRNCFIAIRVIGVSLAIASILKKRNKEYNADAVYSYWNGTQAFASCILKEKGIIKNLFTRCHGYDLYEDRSETKYLPLKRVFNGSFSKWYVICESAKRYLNSTYKVKVDDIEVARLGVDIPCNYLGPSEDGVLRLVSVSYCVELKQVDKIIDALKIYSKLFPNKKITWTHIGDGPLFSFLKQYAEKNLDNTGVQFTFLGHMTNSAVKQYYANNTIDFFINTSKSEGVPVSIMEAMSYGIPVIAPDVGGVSELLEENSCFLLANNFSLDSIVTGIKFMSTKSASIANRELCRNKILNMYSAEVNFNRFVKGIINND